MAKNQNKTKATEASVEEYLANINPQQKQDDCRTLVKIMKEVSKCEPKMWGSIVGFDNYHYKYESGREGDFFKIGFASRAKNITLYVVAYDGEVDKKKIELGKVKLGKGCVYINKLDDINIDLLKNILQDSIKIVEERYKEFN